MAIMYRTIKCPKCGKSFRVREEKIKKTCPYCGNEIVLKNMNDIINEIKDAETISVKTGGTNKDTISELNHFIENYAIYIIIMVICAFIRWIPASSGNPNVDSVINDIVIGGFSSTTVALLIAWHDNKKTEQIKRQSEYRATKSLYSNFFQYFSDLEDVLFDAAFTGVKTCNALKPDSIESVRWSDILTVEFGQSSYSEMLSSDQQQIQTSVEMVLKQEFELFNERILTSEDIGSLYKLKSCFQMNYPLTTSDYTNARIFATHANIVGFLRDDTRFLKKLNEMYTAYKYLIDSRYPEIHEVDDSYGIILMHQRNTKREAIDFLRANGISIDFKAACYAFRNIEDGFLINPEKNSLTSDWWLILNDNKKRVLLVLYIPKDSIEVDEKHNGNGLYVNKYRKELLDLDINKDTLMERKSGMDLSGYLMNTVQYLGLSSEQAGTSVRETKGDSDD